MSDPSKNVRFAESLHKEELKYAPDQINMAPVQDEERRLQRTQIRQPGVMDEQFPTEKFTEYSPEDREKVAKLQVGDQFGLRLAEKSDFDWYQRKQAAAEAANFERWFAKEFDLMDPAQKQRAKELYPEFYASRKKLLKKQAKNLMRLAKIKLEGIQDFKDLQTSYLAETGRLDVGPLNSILNPENAAMDKHDTQKTFVRGLANPFLVFGKEAYPATTASRESQFVQYETRKYDDAQFKRGIDSSGFPPFRGDEATRGDESWFETLSAGLPQP